MSQLSIEELKEPTPRVGGAPVLGLNAIAPLPAAAVYTPPSKFILVICRKLTTIEQKVLADKFKCILTYNAALSSTHDLTQMVFDLLIIDISKDATNASHLFLEMIYPSCKPLNIPIIVLKLRHSNYKCLASALEASVIKEIQEFVGDSLVSYLTKTTLPKLESRLITWAKKLFSSLFA
jgi:hypothetical protein